MTAPQYPSITVTYNNGENALLFVRRVRAALRNAGAQQAADQYAAQVLAGAPVVSAARAWVTVIAVW